MNELIKKYIELLFSVRNKRDIIIVIFALAFEDCWLQVYRFKRWYISMSVKKYISVFLRNDG